MTTNLLEPWTIEELTRRIELVDPLQLLALTRGELALRVLRVGVGHVFHGLVDDCDPQTPARAVVQVFPFDELDGFAGAR